LAPAALTSSSTGPHASSTVPNAASTDAVSVTSTLTARAVPPSVTMASTTLSAAPVEAP
jgi:hypothetical protein